MQLRGSKGAKSIIQRYTARASFVSVPEAGIDIDTPNDRERISQVSLPTALSRDTDPDCEAFSRAALQC
jgi:CTP:molybdopterin cytidylyltransferase MocA